MRKMMLLLSVLSLCALTMSCGAGGSSAGDVGTSKVTITVEDNGRSANMTIEKDSLLAMAERLFMALKGSGIALAAIPSDVTAIVFTITAPDMEPIERTVVVAGQSFITETFTVPNGKNRRFSVEAKNASGDTLYGGHEIYANLDGQPVTISIDMRDFAPPSFEGLQNADPISATQIDLYWDPAYDYYTLEEDFVYQIYMAETSGGQNFASPSSTTTPGATSFSVTGLQPETTYFFVVRATDSNGNQDSNFRETWATTFPTITPDNPPSFAGLVSSTYDSEVNSVDLSWNPASDDRTAQTDIDYLIYMATTSGGQNFAAPNFTTAPGATSYSITGLQPGNYYFVVRARDEAGNMDTNSIERLVDSEPPSIVFNSESPASGVTITTVASWRSLSAITVNFSESIQCSTSSFTLIRSDYNIVYIGPVDGTVNCSEITAAFELSTVLDNDSNYEAMVSGVTDLAGNPMTGDHTWVFYIRVGF